MTKSVIGMKTNVWFSADAPHTDTECLRTRPIPQETFIGQLLDDFGQAWLDGAKSVVDPRFNDGCDRLPLWTILAWKRMAVLIKEREKWAMSYQWLEKQRSRGKEGGETQRVVAKLGDIAEEKPEETMRKKIIRRFHEILKGEQDDRAVGTGLERQFRWISAKGGQVSVGIPAIGNTANAVAVATTHAVKVSITRIKVYRT
jgi:hypothetical protein